MLKSYKNNNTEMENIKEFITVTYVLVDDLYKTYIAEEIQKRLNKNYAILSDSEIITISIVGELLTIDSEKAWICYVKKNMKDLFPKMCDRSRFNRTRKNLMSVIKEIREKLNLCYENYHDEYRIIDSFPLPVCKFGRAHFHRTYRGYGANYGVCASKKETYYGYKVHVLVTLDGYVTDYVITSASVDDRQALWELVSKYKGHLKIIGDKGYISPELAEELKREKNILLIYMKRNKAKDPYPKGFRQLIFKVRRRIETTFSQLTQQLNIEIVKAKSLWGLQTRLETKLLGSNLCFYINQLLDKTFDIARIKELVF